ERALRPCIAWCSRPRNRATLPATSLGLVVMVGGRSIALAGCVSALVLLSSAGTHAAGTDRTPPVFAGLKSAVTCIPGPVGVERTSSFHLVWPAAKDNVTPSRRIVYDIYQAK